MIRKSAPSKCAVLLALLSFLAIPAGAAHSNLERDFKHPPLALKSWPLWHLNGELTTEEIAAQLGDSRDKSGFAGVAVLPVTATKPKYLSEEYFARYGDILETCRQLGLKVVFYLHKVKEGRHVYFIANSTDRRVDTAVTLRGKMNLQRWNPHTGEIAPLVTTDVGEYGQSFTQARLQLEPVKSVFLVEFTAP